MGVLPLTWDTPRCNTPLPKIGYFPYKGYLYYMSCVYENPMIETEIINLLQFFSKLYKFIFDLHQMTIIFENSEFLSYATQ